MDRLTFLLLLTGTILALLYIIILIIGNIKYASYVRELPDKQHYLKALYPAGFYLLKLTGYKYNDKLAKTRLNQCRVVFGEKYAQYYFRLNYAQKAGVCAFILPLVFLSYAFIQNSVAVVIGFLLIFSAYWNYDMKITDIIGKRNAEISRDLPAFLSKLTLLVNAGMIMSEAWQKVSETGDSALYEEMRAANVEIQNGVSEIDAYLNFANRCMDPGIKKIISTLIQNITKGNRELVDYLRKQSAQSWEERKHNVRRQGEKASSKMMIPIGIIFIGILIMIVVPIFTNLSF